MQQQFICRCRVRLGDDCHEVLRGFAFTMLVGVVTGTYSTVFIAAAIAIILSRRSPPAPQTPAGQARARRQ